ASSGDHQERVFGLRIDLRRLDQKELVLPGNAVPRLGDQRQLDISAPPAPHPLSASPSRSWRFWLPRIPPVRRSAAHGLSPRAGKSPDPGARSKHGNAMETYMAFVLKSQKPAYRSRAGPRLVSRSS